jgi:hypothetical protein
VTGPVRAAFDIETVSPQLSLDERPDFEDSRQFELLGGAVAYDYPDGRRESVVHWRDEWGPDAELDLIETLVDALADADRMLTYNGTGFDTIHLAGRARIAGANADRREPFDRAERLLARIDHVDLQPPANDAFGSYTSLEEALSAVGIDPAETDPTAFDHGVGPAGWATDPQTPVQSKDVARLGEVYLDTAPAGDEESSAAAGRSYTEAAHRDRQFPDETHAGVDREALEAMLTHYARADVADLFDLADARPF